MLIRIRDFSDYCPSLSSNGGAYWDAVNYQVREDGTVVKFFTISSEFPYCSVEGRHQECGTCWFLDEQGCTLPYPEVSAGELAQAIVEALANPHVEIAVSEDGEWNVLKTAPEPHRPGYCSRCGE